MRNKRSPGEYLALLSVKYEVDPDRFFSALIAAEEKRKAICGNLLIESRGRQQDKVIFLIMNGPKVVAQFPIAKEFLSEKNNPIKDFRNAMMFRRCLIKKTDGPRSIHIKDLRIGMKRITLKARVLEISKPTFVLTRFGNYASVANALLADETGTIKLCLWNKQIESISIGDTVQIENATASTFRGERQLRIGKKGILRNMGI